VSVEVPTSAAVLDDRLERAELLDDGAHVLFQDAMIQLGLPDLQRIAIESRPVGGIATQGR